VVVAAALAKVVVVVVLAGCVLPLALVSAEM
jgi:hypothetical protein